MTIQQQEITTNAAGFSKHSTLITIEKENGLRRKKEGKEKLQQSLSSRKSSSNYKCF